MSAQYSAENQVSVDIQSWVGIVRIMEKENKCTCLYISYFRSIVFLWILEANKPILFRKTNVNDYFNNEGPAVKRNVAEVFGNNTFRKFNISPEGHCEDRSLSCSNAIHPIPESSQKDGLSALHLVEDEEDENQQPDPRSCPVLQMPITPVVDLLVKQNSLYWS